MKRIVTGHGADGKSIFVSAGAPPHTISATAMRWHEIWGTFPEDGVSSPAPGEEPYNDPRWVSVFPPVGHTAFRIIEFRPEEYQHAPNKPLWDEVEMDHVRHNLPGVLEHLEPENPGMHTTDTIDYGVVLSGRIVLELDDGASVELEAGDVVVQNGTRHAWRPKERTRMAFFMIGAQRKRTAS